MRSFDRMRFASVQCTTACEVLPSAASSRRRSERTSRMSIRRSADVRRPASHSFERAWASSGTSGPGVAWRIQTERRVAARENCLRCSSCSARRMISIGCARRNPPDCSPERMVSWAWRSGQPSRSAISSIVEFASQCWTKCGGIDPSSSMSWMQGVDDSFTRAGCPASSSSSAIRAYSSRRNSTGIGSQWISEVE